MVRLPVKPQHCAECTAGVHFAWTVRLSLTAVLPFFAWTVRPSLTSVLPFFAWTERLSLTAVLTLIYQARLTDRRKSI